MVLYHLHTRPPTLCKRDLVPLLTYSMVQSPSWAAKWFAASQEIPRISRNPKVHYRTQKGPPPVSILGQPNPVHIPTSHLLEFHPNIIHPSTPRSPQWFFHSGFPTKTLYTPSPSPHPYAPHAQPISFFSLLSPAQYWVRSTNPRTYTNTNNCFVLYRIYIASQINCIQPDDGHRSTGRNM